MAFTYSLSTKSDGIGRKEILIRYKSGKYAARAKSSIYIRPEWCDFVVGRQSETIYKGKRIITDEMTKTQSYHEKQKAKLSEINVLISEDLKVVDRNNPEWLRDCIDKYYKRGKYVPQIEAPEYKQPFFEAFEECISKRNIGDVRKNNFKVISRALQRYELYKQEKQNNFTLAIDTFTVDTLEDFVIFLRQEYKLYETHPKLYEQIPESRKPEPRGQNTINDVLTKMRTFFIWAVDKGKTDNNPFRNYNIEECVYGTPYYISIDERNQLYHADISHRPALAIQRDIFVFQCLIGCRVSDLYKFTKQNIINGAVEYIARKTKDGRPVTVRVPLNSIAKEILDRYANSEGDSLLPFISTQKYNDAIKDMFTIAGLNRNVVILDPLTRESVIRPLNEIASSHLARRCFVGNLYKQVKDPNLVGALSGHKEGSKAFVRYRGIDEEMKNELVKMLE
jgi:site-specific recombinase XerD